MKSKLIFVVLTYLMVRVVVWLVIFVKPLPFQEYIIDFGCKETVTRFSQLQENNTLPILDSHRKDLKDSIVSSEGVKYYFFITSYENMVFTVCVDSINNSQSMCELIYIRLLKSTGAMIAKGNLREFPLLSSLRGVKTFEKNILDVNFEWEKPHPFPLFDAIIYFLHRNMSIVTYSIMAMALLLISIMIYRHFKKT